MSDGYLNGQLLLAMPAMQDPRFARSVVYLCMHNAEGAFGLIINRLIESVSFQDLLDHLGVRSGLADGVAPPRIHYGGPVEEQRGFVLHSSDCMLPDSVLAGDDIALTGTTEIIRELADGRGPRHHILAIGYAGWGPEQLEHELQDNAWLSVAADPGLVWETDAGSKWEQGMAKIGVDTSLLSSVAGRA